MQGILSSENNHVVTLDLGTVTCVALDPSFGQSRPKTRFAVGETFCYVVDMILLTVYFNNSLRV